MAGGTNRMRQKLLKELKVLLTRFVDEVQTETLGLLSPVAALALVPYVPGLAAHAPQFAENVASEFGDLILRMVQTGLSGRDVVAFSKLEDRLTDSVASNIAHHVKHRNTEGWKATHWRLWTKHLREGKATGYYPAWPLLKNPPMGLPPITLDYVLSFASFEALAEDFNAIGAWPGLITERLADVVLPAIPTTSPTPDPASQPTVLPAIPPVALVAETVGVVTPTLAPPPVLVPVTLPPPEPEPKPSPPLPVTVASGILPQTVADPGNIYVDPTGFVSWTGYMPVEGEALPDVLQDALAPVAAPVSILPPPGVGGNGAPPVALSPSGGASEGVPSTMWPVAAVAAGILYLALSRG